MRAAVAKTALTVVSLATKKMVSCKSNPSYYVKPLATSLTLNLSIIPYALYFILYNHFHPMGVLPTGKSTTVQVLFYSRDSISSFMA